MNIGILINNLSYTPESYAYTNYLRSKGWVVQLDSTLDTNNDINIYYMGIRPFWRKKEGRALEIHEYQSLSTAPYAKLKNLLKKNINNKPAGRIFLNEVVETEFSFGDKVPFIYRDMGVDDLFFKKDDTQPEFDIVYAGSIDSRVGLIEVILSLAKMGFSILIIGILSDVTANRLKKYSQIVLIGKVNYTEVPRFYRLARFGLNFTPDLYPYNIQTSTKTLEYMASGLGVISNRYIWAESFFKEINYSPIWLEDIHSKSLYDNRLQLNLDFEQYRWSNILERSNFTNFLETLLSK